MTQAYRVSLGLPTLIKAVSVLCLHPEPSDAKLSLAVCAFISSGRREPGDAVVH